MFLNFSKDVKLFPFRYWSKESFNLTNDNKPFQPLNFQACKKCKKCEKQEFDECDDVKNLKRFQQKQNQILDKFEEKCIFLCEYINKGGEGIIFVGYRKNQAQQYDDNLILKILFDINEEDIQQEIDIMNLFEMNINVFKLIDHFKIEGNSLNIHVLILEKCKCRLLDQLNVFQNKKSYPSNELFKIIFDLLDGLIQLRVYNILHLDIKPSNILLSNLGNYVYTDFGMSSLKKTKLINSYKRRNILL